MKYSFLVKTTQPNAGCVVFSQLNSGFFSSGLSVTNSLPQ